MKYHEPNFLRYERKVIEERLQQIFDGREQGDRRQRIGSQQQGGFQPQTRRAEQWTVGPYWDLDRPTPVQPAQYNTPDRLPPTQDRDGVHRFPWKKEK